MAKLTEIKDIDSSTSVVDSNQSFSAPPLVPEPALMDSGGHGEPQTWKVGSAGTPAMEQAVLAADFPLPLKSVSSKVDLELGMAQTSRNSMLASIQEEKLKVQSSGSGLVGVANISASHLDPSSVLFPATCSLQHKVSKSVEGHSDLVSDVSGSEILENAPSSSKGSNCNVSSVILTDATTVCGSPAPEFSVSAPIVSSAYPFSRIASNLPSSVTLSLVAHSFPFETPLSSGPVGMFSTCPTLAVGAPLVTPSMASSFFSSSSSSSFLNFLAVFPVPLSKAFNVGSGLIPGHQGVFPLSSLTSLISVPDSHSHAALICPDLCGLGVAASLLSGVGVCCSGVAGPGVASSSSLGDAGFAQPTLVGLNRFATDMSGVGLTHPDATSSRFSSSAFASSQPVSFPVTVWSDQLDKECSFEEEDPVPDISFSQTKENEYKWMVDFIRSPRLWRSLLNQIKRCPNHSLQ
ncbi:uncharacterized protein [Macrobrachium rosenbergii]|uniref:uncharacterized protein n=1 Tax=Macrobrachium rosenbergii TaxID=79674 RepID=UPI0034D62405